MNYFEWMDRKLHHHKKPEPKPNPVKPQDIVQPTEELIKPIEPKQEDRDFIEVKEEDASDSVIKKFRAIFKKHP